MSIYYYNYSSSIGSGQVQLHECVYHLLLCPLPHHSTPQNPTVRCRRRRRISRTGFRDLRPVPLEFQPTSPGQKERLRRLRLCTWNVPCTVESCGNNFAKVALCCTDKKYTMQGDSFWKKTLLCIIYSYIPTQAMEPQTTTSKRAREPFFKPSKISKKGCAMMLSAGSKVLAPSYALHKSFPDVKPETLTAVVSLRSGDMTMWTSSRRQW